ncbi:potassium voltage-gated channel subfamily A member 1-like [Haliotis asinina]|uniref:potassium voltage-gated channel subfamily A member 1-like n=1 Tax=Haliotis asinina TaxID=109174 RepID=UPI0035323186
MHFVPHTAPDRNYPHNQNYHLKPGDGYLESLSLPSRHGSICSNIFQAVNHDDIDMDEFGSSNDAFSRLLTHGAQSRADSYCFAHNEDLPEDHDCRRELCTRVTINVSGMKFETQLRTLNRLPHTLLGDPEKRAKYWDKKRQEYFFDRHRLSFPAILYYYQSGGRLKRPLDVPWDIFRNELYFYELGNTTIANFERTEGVKQKEEMIMKPSNKIQLWIWEVMEVPQSSYFAKIVAVLSVVFILVSVVTFCIETLPQFKGRDCVNQTIDIGNNKTEIRKVPNYWEPLFLTESCCIAWFVTETIVRFCVSYSKTAFLKSLSNWIDIIAICPYFVFLFITLATNACIQGDQASGLSVLRVLRVVRILKLSKHSQGLQILGMTLKCSMKELSMFLLFLGIATVIFAGAVYYAEMAEENGQFTSIPDAFWWAIVSMTTVGYGDYVPQGVVGKCLGVVCLVSGVLAIALPVPVIVANFNHFYTQYTGRGYGSL